MLSCLVLQTDARGLVRQAMHIGILQTVVTVAVFPVVIYLVGSHVADGAREAKDATKEKFPTPMDGRRRRR